MLQTGGSSMSMLSKNTHNLRQRVVQSSSWTFIGYGINQSLRLGGNLILTRILFPEAFGMMAIIMGVIYGVTMVTDVGVGPSIVQKEGGNDPDFLNTAWTVQIVRGFLVWIGLCILAYPIARIYGEPLLAGMLPVVGLGAIIGGFNSTKLLTAQRNLEAARVMQIEVGSYALSLLGTIFLAWLLQSVWALVFGILINSTLKMIASHAAIHGIKNKFAWNRDALDHLRGFGRWIMFGSALTFLSVEGARLLIGAILDMRQLALFTLASTMSLMFWQAMQQLSARVFFPAFAEVHRSNPKNLIRVLYKTRLALIFPNWGLAVLFIFFGTQLMETLYDKRYHGSGQMLELLATGSLINCVWGSYSGVLLARGKVATESLLTLIQIICQISAIYIGYHYWSGIGIVMGVAAANWIMYPVHAYVMHRNRLWQPKLDLMLLAASMLVVVLAWPRFGSAS